MLDIKPLSTDKVISCTAPIEINKLQEYFNDKDIRFEIDYSNSSLQEKKLLIYFSNINVPVDLVSVNQLEYAFRATLLLSYMTLPIITPIFT